MNENQEDLQEELKHQQVDLSLEGTHQILEHQKEQYFYQSMDD